MTNRLTKIVLAVEASHPQLLEGLDVWCRLGLISDEEIRQISRDRLSCGLPDPLMAAAPVSPPSLTTNLELPVEVARSKPKRTPILTRTWRSLLDELSVRWLLFLGVLLVVVSSGVLAASQWAKFSPVGQYGVLLGYTLVFWLVSWWAGKQPNLRLTASTLQIATLMLVPVNFWAMDRFGLWGFGGGWTAVAIATLALTFMTVQLLRDRPTIGSAPSRQLQWLPVGNILGLSYLHWGWNIAKFPAIAVYIGMVGTAVIIYYRTRQRLRIAALDRERAGLTLDLAASVTIYAAIVLLVRAIFVAGVNVTQLGLALGICGWLIAWLGQQDEKISGRAAEKPPEAFPWEKIGGILLLLGWFVSAGERVPWQATAVSALGLWFLDSRLRRFWRKVDLVALFAVGLQMAFLAWQLVPLAVREWAIASAVRLTGSDAGWAWLGVVLLPYLAVILVYADWLYRSSQPKLAHFAEQIALAFGMVLTAVSLANPTLRSLNLLGSTVAVAIFNSRRAFRGILVYLTHALGLLTLVSGIDRWFPSLGSNIWGAILLVLMVGEWGFSSFKARSPDTKMQALRIWQRSAWDLGLVLAVVSYVLLQNNIYRRTPNWEIIWLVTPITLTLVASRTLPPQRMRSSWLSAGALVIVQYLIWEQPGIRLFSLVVATGLMLVNTRYLGELAAAAITIGFGLSAIALLLWDVLPGFSSLSPSVWYLVAAIAIFCLWLATQLSGRLGTLAAIYAEAADRWAVGTCFLELVLITLHAVTAYSRYLTPDLFIISAIPLLIGAISYRTWQQPNNWAFYGCAWGVELLAAEMLGFFGYALINLSIANVILGILTQIIGGIWQGRNRLTELPTRWQVLPLLYAALSVVLRANSFTAWTGLCTLGVAAIAIGTGTRETRFKPLVYLGLIGVSVSAYELLLYQLLRVPRGALGDGLIAISALGAVLMYVYRFLPTQIVNYLTLSRQQSNIIADFHWAWGSCLLVAVNFTTFSSAQIVGLITGIVLIQYAIFKGRHPNAKAGEIWVYLGLLGTFAIKIYWLNTPFGQLFAGVLFPGKAAIACIWAYLFYTLPWGRWGWQKRAWQRAAIALPLIFVVETSELIYPIVLVITALFYVLLAYLSKQIRLTYIATVLVDWAILRWAFTSKFSDILSYVIPIGLSVLYIAQVEPSLRSPQQRQSRHYLRSLGTGTICVVALLFHQHSWLVPVGLSAIAIFAGLALRIRAFLYIGTATFLGNIFYQLIILISQQSFMKWIVGLIVGIAFIAIAANFETRRQQWTSFASHWVAELREWE